VAHAPIKSDISPEWVRALDDIDDSMISVGGLAHRLGMRQMALLTLLSVRASTGRGRPCASWGQELIQLLS
jgi:hypothetical protein